MRSEVVGWFAAGLLGAGVASAGGIAERAADVNGLGAPVVVEFDGLGVPRIRAEAFTDVARAQGFVHAQERFFQMDLMRRRSAGRLSEIGGERTIWMDRQARVYGFDEVSAGVLADLPAHHRAWLEAYSAGVNAGLADLGAPPLEYALLGVMPEAWEARHSILAMLTMTLDLSTGEGPERVRSALADALPAEVVDLLTPTTTRFDAPLDAGEDDWSGGYRPLEVPRPDAVSVREKSAGAIRRGSFADLLFEDDRAAMGSNSWAVAGSRTAHGGAIVANDMHLTLSLPNIWYRVQLEWSEEENGAVRAMRLVGVSLPGVPGIVAGSSGRLAWGFTNLTGDLVDLVRIELDPEDPDRYRVGEAWERFGRRTEVIGVNGADSIELEVLSTRWGPVVDPAHDGGVLAMRWAALEPEASNLRLLDLPWAASLEEGVEVMRSWMGAPQNAILADDQGDIAWTVTGYIPQRRGFDGRVSVSWADGDVGWVGSIAGEDRPAILRPESGRLFTANNRVHSGVRGSLLYGDAFANGTRAMRIRELLDADRQWDELSVFSVAMDTRVRLMDPYRVHLTRAVGEGARDDGAVALALDLVVGWDGTAGADQAGYRLLREYRTRLHRAVLGPLVEPAQRAFPGLRYSWYGNDEAVLLLLDRRPDHLLDPKYANWEDLLEREFVRLVHDLGPGAEGGIETPWGDVNRATIAHPLADAAPERMRAALSAPRTPQPGDLWAVRVARPGFGASERFAISPGREESGLLHMPGGQSGRPLSPHFVDQHRAWLEGLPLPLLAGEAKNRLVLNPRADDEE